MAIMASWLTEPHLKRGISPSKYMDRLDPKEKQKTTAEETKKELSDLVAEFGGGVELADDRGIMG